MTMPNRQGIHLAAVAAGLDVPLWCPKCVLQREGLRTVFRNQSRAGQRKQISFHVWPVY